MGCGFTFKGVHLLKLRQLKATAAKHAAEADALAAELAAHAAASERKQEEQREDIAETTTQVAELNESWGVMREMYETSKRMKKMRERALIRKVMGRFMYATAATCLKEWAALTRRRKVQCYKHEWQTKAEDLAYEAKSLKKAVSEASNKLHFVADKAQAERVRGLVARMGFRNTGMWFLMWRSFLKVSYDERREQELEDVRTETAETIDHSARLEKKVIDQEQADAQMSADLTEIVAADAARHSSMLPAVLGAVAVAEMVTKRQLAVFPAGSRHSGLSDHISTLRRNGTALGRLGVIADEATADGMLPPVDGAAPLSPPVALNPAPPAFSPARNGTVGIEESINTSIISLGGQPKDSIVFEVASKAHQRSRPYSRGRTLVTPAIQDVRELKLGGRNDLSLPGGAGSMRGSLRRKFSQQIVVPIAPAAKLDSPRAAVRPAA